MKAAFRTTAAATMLLATSCAPNVAQVRALRLSPEQAVMNAAATPLGVAGVFEMVVRSIGRQDNMLYLNSEQDYRDPRNLTIAIGPMVERALERRAGMPADRYVLRRVIAVRGVARKTRIDFTDNGVRTGKYYYQTHLLLRSDRDLTVEGERPAV